jgi:hypothetical protein
LVGGIIDDRLKVKALLGAGCFGHDYRAVPVDDSDREVCIKVFPSNNAFQNKQVQDGQKSDSERLTDIAQAAKSDFEMAGNFLLRPELKHKNIISFNHVTPPGRPGRITISNEYSEAVLLTMAGASSEYTTAKLDSIKYDLAAKLHISPSVITVTISDNAAAAAAPAIGVAVCCVVATMPREEAEKVVAGHAAGTLTTLGQGQVRKESDCSIRLLCPDVEHFRLR